MKIIFESDEERRAFEILSRALYEIDRNSSHTPLDQVRWERKIFDVDKIEEQIYGLEEEIENLQEERDRLYDRMDELPESEGDEPTPEYLALEEKEEQIDQQIGQLEEQKDQLEKQLKVWELAEQWALYPEKWMEWWAGTGERVGKSEEQCHPGSSPGSGEHHPGHREGTTSEIDVKSLVDLMLGGRFYVAGDKQSADKLSAQIRAELAARGLDKSHEPAPWLWMHPVPHWRVRIVNLEKEAGRERD